MITVVELTKRLKGLADDIESSLNGEVMPVIASDAIVLIKKRVQESGTNAEGSQFPPYSTKAMLAGKKSFKTDAAFNKMSGSKTKRKELKWVTLGEGDSARRLFEIPGGYKQFRELHGKQTGFVDFSFTNEMWNNIQVVSSSSEHQNGVAVIAAKKESEKKKLAGNTERKGDILKLSNKEIETISNTYNAHVEKLIQKNGLA